ncbi:MAG: tripartite tricarboxylate transporter substrate binding protein [Pseudolabrys sp.]|nr:tripartite tricarboxylate transporter substrate binding protein [Pseudolabrys sp.]MSP32517.1 tripartite tricarboxylate transporter substrate binding protein [Pseudolabrys sp.]
MAGLVPGMTKKNRGGHMKKCAAAVVLAIALFAGGAAAQDYPSRPIHVLTTSSAGGLSDIFMRVLGEELQKRTGQPLIIENRPGAAGNIATRACTEAAPDGYTICIIMADALIYNQFLFKKLPYDPEKLTPIINLFHLIQVLVVNSDLKVKTVDELVAASKAKAGTFNYLTASLPLAVYMDSLKRDKGADWVRVPFKGGGEATNAILSGTTPIGLIGLGNVLSQIEGGKMTALVLTNNIRSPQLPNVPIFTDIGYKGAPSQTWYGLFAPPGTPKPIIDKLNAEVTRAMNHPEFRDKYIIARSMVPAINTPEQFAQQIKADRAAAEQVVKESGLQPQ